ncbi:hypothetical protein GNI_050290 [Gregarina niphandrodes]|uniref:Uncharacterized protein n=1 Tax=Gregarina niphandrodes TaxID=110365 RepID=A0A023B9J5_GRENI|nr:hypothetical protein GNI_050290 [Gregarina niphandrodes]EZG72870.1 hypothetical protein GNI_050290 [Gregarina niphandrodes]|eukprot:XP_011129729.1 hypothetical protein GNI_050290 [Gregarina niphandrodes]
MLNLGSVGPHEDAMVPEEEVQTLNEHAPSLDPDLPLNDESSLTGILSDNSLDLVGQPRSDASPSSPDRELVLRLSMRPEVENTTSFPSPIFGSVAPDRSAPGGAAPVIYPGGCVPTCVQPERSVSCRRVLRRPADLLRSKNVDELEEQAVYEEEDRSSNVTRRHIYTRSVKPRSLWNKHEQFRRWVYSLFSAVVS